MSIGGADVRQFGEESIPFCTILVKTNRPFRIGAMKMTVYRTILFYTQYSRWNQKAKTGSAK
jgi:beta-lactamase class D